VTKSVFMGGRDWKGPGPIITANVLWQRQGRQGLGMFAQSERDRGQYQHRHDAKDEHLRNRGAQPPDLRKAGNICSSAAYVPVWELVNDQPGREAMHS
jgi:hypothetical protein